MTNLIGILIVLCFFFAVGIFYTLSLMEKTVWRLMRSANSVHVPDADVERVQAVLQSVVNYLPPTMKALILSGLALLGMQTWLLDFELMSLAMFVSLVIFLMVGMPLVQRSINEVGSSSASQTIEAVRAEVSKVLWVHHSGLVVSLIVGILQIVLIMRIT